jgi:hypothetical protein
VIYLKSDSSEEFLSHLEADLDEYFERLKQIREAFNKSQIGLETYKQQKAELEASIEEISKRIYYIQKAKQKIPTKEERIAHELELLRNEYQVELVNGNRTQLRVYLTVSVQQTWVIEINFCDPKIPLLKIPSDLPLLIGNPYDTIESLRFWTGKPIEHLVNIIREIEEKLLNLELTKSLPELELERGRVMEQARKLEEKMKFKEAMTFYNYAADISERIGNQSIAIMCRLKAKKILEEIESDNSQSTEK